MSQDYKSKVPHYSFPDDLETQEAGLRDNPLILRFTESRRRMAGDRYRPRYHYVNPESTLNDPNGLSFWKGNWHLFYQAYPPEDPRQHWGHAISSDLIHWRDLPYAIYPNPERCCFSGSTLVEEDRVIAMYHGTEVGNMVAVSTDPLLLNWEKLSGAAVIPMVRSDGTPQPHRIFDPCIWREGSFYYSLSGGQTSNGPDGKLIRSNALFRSADLVAWEYLHLFVDGDTYSYIGDDGACPYFWPIGEKHMLLHFSHMSGGKYLIGDYDTSRNKLVVTDGGKFNFGAFGPAGIHAPSAAPDGNGGVNVIFNMNSGKPTTGWNQLMSLPRNLTYIGDDTVNPIHVAPAGDIASLRGAVEQHGPRILRANETHVVNGAAGDSIEIHAVFEPGEAQSLEIGVLCSPDGRERTRIICYRKRGFFHREFDRRNDVRSGLRDSIVTIDSTESSIASDVMVRPPESAPVYLDDLEPLDLRIFIDRSVVEVFVNEKQCLAVRVYPELRESLGVSMISRGCDTALTKCDIWQMASIYE